MEGDQPSCHGDNLVSQPKTCERIAQENGVNWRSVIRSEKFAQNVDVAEADVPGTREKILSGKVKSTAAELAAVSSAAPEERPGLVAELCRPRQEKRTARQRTTVQESETAQGTQRLRNKEGGI